MDPFDGRFQVHELLRERHGLQPAEIDFDAVPEKLHLA
jgi:hypothetical protein